jgi:hypothetical protein
VHLVFVYKKTALEVMMKFNFVANIGDYEQIRGSNLVSSLQTRVSPHKACKCSEKVPAQQSDTHATIKYHNTSAHNTSALNTDC